MKTASRMVFVLCLIGVVALAGALTVQAQPAREAYTGVAKWKNPRGEAKTARLTIVIERYTTEEEREKAKEALKAGGTAALRKVLEKMPATGYVELNEGSRSATYYAFSRDTAGGRMITVITDRPLGFIGGNDPKAKPKEGYDVGIVNFEIKQGKLGSGEVAPAAKVKINPEGALVIEDYGGRQVWLEEVQPK